MEQEMFTLTEEEIPNLGFHEMLQFVGEAARPPGGLRTVHQIASRCHLASDSFVVDVGTSAGTSAIEFARLTGCRVLGVDLDGTRLDQARRRASRVGSLRIDFKEANALDLPLSDGEADLLMCANVGCLIGDKQRAFDEFTRVVRDNGFIVVAPMYYVREPESAVLDRLAQATGMRLPVNRRADVQALFVDDRLELLDELDHEFGYTPDDELDAHTEKVFAASERVADLGAPARDALVRRYTEQIYALRDSFAHMGYTVFIMRKGGLNDPAELFQARQVNW